MKKLALLLAAVLLFGLLAGCSGGGDGTSGAAAPADDGATGEPAGDGGEDSGDLNVFNVGRLVELDSMDSCIATESDSIEMVAATVAGLFRNNEDGTQSPMLVESEEVNEDGTVYTFHLRQDAIWSNDAPVTAHDFVFAWRRLVDPATAAEYSYLMEIIGCTNASAIIAGEMDKEELGIKAVDDYTLEITLDRPVPFFRSLMTFPSFFPINEEFYNSVGDQYALGVDNLLSCGPFYLSEWEVGGTTYQAKKNPKYFDADSVEADVLNFQIIKDTQQTMLVYETGELDYVRLAGEQISKYESDPAFRRIEEGFLWFLSMNINPANDAYATALSNHNLRMAIALSFDKEAICNEILKDGSVPAYFAIPNNLATGPDGQDFRATADTYLHTDKEAAKEYWEAAKEELGTDTVEFELLFEDSEASPLIAQFIQSEVETNLPGVSISLQSQPKKNRLELMQNREYQMGLTRWGPDYADPMTYLDMWVTDSVYNYGSWNNTEYDDLVTRSLSGDLATKPEERWQALKDAEAVAMEDVVIIPVYQKGSAVMVREGITGIWFHPVGIGTYFDKLHFE